MAAPAVVVTAAAIAVALLGLHIQFLCLQSLYVILNQLKVSTIFELASKIWRSTDKDMKDKLNKYVKFREDFRPFAPSVLEERAPEYFTNCRYAPFMAITYNVRPEKVRKIPTPTHVDNTARVQTVSKIQHGLYYDLIRNLEYETGIPVVTNTSLNIKDQPICLSPVDAISTFYSTGMDGIALGNYLLLKEDG